MPSEQTQAAEIIGRYSSLADLVEEMDRVLDRLEQMRSKADALLAESQAALDRAETAKGTDAFQQRSSEADEALARAQAALDDTAAAWDAAAPWREVASILEEIVEQRRILESN